MRRSLAHLSLLACSALPLISHADPISTDRPDYVESSDVVGKGRFQLETGFSSEHDRSDGLRTRVRTTPTLLRFGVSDSVELRVETDGRGWARLDDRASGTREYGSGWNDVALGLKWRTQAGDEDKGTPSIAWLVHADTASGSSGFRGQGVRPSLRMVAEWDLPGEVGIGIMPGIVFDRDAGGGHFVNGILAVTLGKAWTPKWRTYVEVAGQQLAAKRHGGSVVTFDTGVTYLVTDDLQVDFGVSRGITRDAPDWQWGTGLSIRF